LTFRFPSRRLFIVLRCAHLPPYYHHACQAFWFALGIEIDAPCKGFFMSDLQKVIKSMEEPFLADR
ncbi:MAG: hypothetical protein ABI795_07050, partial [Chthoniobacterales bacterium]